MVHCSWYAEGRGNVLLAQKLMTPRSHGTGTAASAGKTTKYNEMHKASQNYSYYFDPTSVKSKH
jgi:hypothetical protein